MPNLKKEKYKQIYAYTNTDKFINTIASGYLGRMSHFPTKIGLLVFEVFI